VINNKRKKIKRSRQIFKVFANHGFGALIDRSGILDFFRVRKTSHQMSEQISGNLSVGERLRLSFEELGPTYIKLGQIMSTRADLLPHDIIYELEKLQDEVAPFPMTEVREVIEHELGDTLENIFKEFHEYPIAAASIGQVHRAKLLSGKDVVVKYNDLTLKKIFSWIWLFLKTWLILLIPRHALGLFIVFEKWLKSLKPLL
jgi:ubiquinone biosynthesis protein